MQNEMIERTAMTNDTSRSSYQGLHLLSRDYAVNTDTWQSGLNNNVLIFGPTGSGKTRNYVLPNVLRSHESMIISDTKGSLYGQVGPLLARRGFDVKVLNFTSLAEGCGYNPLDYIRYDAAADRYSEKDILSLASCLISSWSQKEPYWDHAARQYLACLISYVLEALPRSEHTLEYVFRLFCRMDQDAFPALMDELELTKPGSTTVLRYNALKSISRAEKMDASIRGIISTNLDPLCFDEALALYRKPDKIDFAALGRRKTALFVTISDTDRSLDKLADAFMTQALQVLCRSADHDYPEHRLPVPVRFYLDDFATNLYIPDFDKIISVIRSREISVSVILQSLTQLSSLYGPDRADTILSNCDHMLYLGGQDLDTARYISQRADSPLARVLCMPLDKAWLLVRGRAAMLTEKADSPSLQPEGPEDAAAPQPEAGPAAC